MNDTNCLPAGRYLVRVAKVTDGATRNGDWMITLTLAVEEGEHEGRFVWDRLIFSPKAARRARHIASVLGVAPSDESSIEPEALLGRRCYVKTEVEQYEGRSRTKIRFWGYEPLVEVQQDSPCPVQQETPFQ